MRLANIDGLSDSNIHHTIVKVENALIRLGLFNLAKRHAKPNKPKGHMPKIQVIHNPNSKKVLSIYADERLAYSYHHLFHIVACTRPFLTDHESKQENLPQQPKLFLLQNIRSNL